MKAIIVGATGATGKDVLTLLLEDKTFSQVIIFVRKPIEIQHSKLTTHIINFETPSQWENLVQGDVLFSCLGTTLKNAGSKSAQWRVDYDYQYQFAQIAKQNGVKQYILVSSMMANAQSKVFYLQMKGKLEEAVKKLGFERLVILNPPALIRQNSTRKGEKIGVKILKMLNSIGLFHSQKPMDTKILAQTMVNLSKSEEKGVFQLLTKDIFAKA